MYGSNNYQELRTPGVHEESPKQSTYSIVFSVCFSINFLILFCVGVMVLTSEHHAMKEENVPDKAENIWSVCLLFIIAHVFFLFCPLVLKISSQECVTFGKLYLICTLIWGIFVWGTSVFIYATTSAGKMDEIHEELGPLWLYFESCFILYLIMYVFLFLCFTYKKLCK